MFRFLFVLALFALLALNAGPAAATAWPSNSTGTNIGGALPSGFEPSGIVWDNPSGYLWVVDDEGDVSRMQRDGAGTVTWTLQSGLDLESIAVTGTTFKLYLGQESPPTILEYNTSTATGTNPPAPTATGNQWQLDFSTTSSSGMEGLTWVPDGYHPYGTTTSGGVFYAASQKNGKIYVYDVNLSQSGTSTRKGSFLLDSSNKDISDLYFSKDTRTLFVLYDTANKLLEVNISTTNPTITTTYTLPTSTTGQEGVTLLPQCPGATTLIYIADDQGSSAHNVFSFNNFPQACAP